MRSLKIDNYEINDDSDCYVIAEIGHNHQGSIEKCKEMFLRAKQSGAHAVKLQKRHNVSLFTKDFYSSAYNSENSFGATYGEHRDALEFAHEEYSHLIEYAREIGITFFATAFDFESADFLEKLDMPAFKVASGDIINIPLLKHIAQIDKPMLISTGGANMDDIQRAYDTIMPINRQLCIMQCTAEYPVKAKDMNLRVIESFRKVFPDIIIGSSDHQSGISMALMGYVLGARVIEKHFTLNRAAKGTDHAFSLEPQGLTQTERFCI